MTQPSTYDKYAQPCGLYARTLSSLCLHCLRTWVSLHNHLTKRSPIYNNMTLKYTLFRCYIQGNKQTSVARWCTETVCGVLYLSERTLYRAARSVWDVEMLWRCIRLDMCQVVSFMGAHISRNAARIPPTLNIHTHILGRNKEIGM